MTQANGSNVADGTVVNSAVTPGTNGTLESIRNGTTGGASGTTVGGIVNFVFTGAGAGGNTTLTFSTADGAGKSVTATVSVAVSPAPTWRMTVDMLRCHSGQWAQRCSRSRTAERMVRR
ncbi:MAG: hypothetical protein V9G12_24225 [Microthrixaceae bacterium]